MKIALLAAAATAITLSSGTAAVLSSSVAVADTVQSSPYRPFGAKLSPTDRAREREYRAHRHYEAQREYARRAYIRHSYAPVYSPPPAVRHAAARLNDVRERVHADGRVTLFEKIRLKAAENRYNATLRGYR